MRILYDSCDADRPKNGAKRIAQSGTILAKRSGQESVMKNGAHDTSRHTPLRSVAVIARDPQPTVLDTVLEAGDYDVVFMESIENAYSGIKRATPDLVIICLGI